MTPRQFYLVSQRVTERSRLSVKDYEECLLDAEAYLRLYHQECGMPHVYAHRLEQVQKEVESTGTYQQTSEELSYGAKVAWRNNTRCIGRLHWKSLTIRDMRHITTAEGIFEALVEHIRFATNEGKIRSTITVFAQQLAGQPGIRIWNPQLIRYAGYRQADGSVVGDNLHVELTRAVEQLGWKGARGTAFDVLPLVIQMPNQPPRLFELPQEVIMEVPLSHPDYPWFADMGLKWHALPVISNMRLDIGGVSYPAAPFNGWYMGTEIGARNLGDINRYHLLPFLAEKMGLDTHNDRSLWRDRALVELNVAVLHSFAKYGVTMVDHHTASRQFMLHDELEKRQGRVVPAHWVWLIPPISGSACPMFHVKRFKNILLKPNYFYQCDPWQEAVERFS